MNWGWGLILVLGGGIMVQSYQGQPLSVRGYDSLPHGLRHHPFLFS
jgi:hypothetical protein